MERDGKAKIRVARGREERKDGRERRVGKRAVEKKEESIERNKLYIYFFLLLIKIKKKE